MQRPATMCLFHVFALAVVVALVGRFEGSSAQLTWTQIEPRSGSTPPPRSNMALAYDSNNDRLFMFGGDGDQLYNDLWTFDLRTRLWNEIHGPQADSVAGYPKQRFSIISGFYTQTGQFLISTGEGNGKRVFFDDIWAFDPSFTSGTGWRELPSRGSVPEKRYGAAGGLHMNGTSLYISHGFSNRRFSDTVRYDLLREEWVSVFDGVSKYSATEPHPRCLVGHAMVSADEPIFFGGCLSGGFSGGPCPGADSWALRNGKWARMDDCASARQYSGMADWPFVADTAVLFGGIETDRSVIMNEKAKDNEVDFVNTATGKWRRLAASGANGSLPDLRRSHGMVAVSDGVIIYGGASTTGRGSLNDLWLLTGDPDMAGEVGSCGPRWFLFMHLHGFFMIISWGIVLTAGVFIARYFRHTAPLWFKIHQAAQITGASLSLLGIILVFPGTRAVPNFAHSVFGILILIFSIQQVINGLRRPHKEKGVEPPKKRVYWEYWHMWGGRFFLLLGGINISLGVYLIIAPVAVIAIWFVIFALWIIAFIVFEIKLQKFTRKDL